MPGSQALIKVKVALRAIARRESSERSMAI
jgi:hypothetical protein